MKKNNSFIRSPCNHNNPKAAQQEHLKLLCIKRKKKIQQNVNCKGKQQQLEQNPASLCTSLPFIIQWCRNVKDAARPPDTALRPGEGLSSLHSAVTRPSSGSFQAGGVEGGGGGVRSAHPPRGICRKHDHRGNVNAFLSSGQTIRQLFARYSPKDAGGGGGGEADREHARAHVVIRRRCAAWDEVIAAPR